MQHKTTEDLRATLFECIDQVLKGQMTRTEASAVANLADKIISSAALEIKYSLTLDRLDRTDNGISVGPLLLTRRQETPADE